LEGQAGGFYFDVGDAGSGVLILEFGGEGLVVEECVGDVFGEIVDGVWVGGGFCFVDVGGDGHCYGADVDGAELDHFDVEVEQLLFVEPCVAHYGEDHFAAGQFHERHQDDGVIGEVDPWSKNSESVADVFGPFSPCHNVTYRLLGEDQLEGFGVLKIVVEGRGDIVSKMPADLVCVADGQGFVACGLVEEHQGQRDEQYGRDEEDR